MKKITLILSSALLMFAGGCSKEVTIDKLVERIGSDGERLAYEVNSSTPFTGTSIRIHRGEVDRRVTYKNGLKDGLLEEICRSGRRGSFPNQGDGKSQRTTLPAGLRQWARLSSWPRGVFGRKKQR